MGFFKKLGKGLLITGAVAGISALAIKNKIETKEAEKRGRERIWRMGTWIRGTKSREWKKKKYDLRIWWDNDWRYIWNYCR